MTQAIHFASPDPDGGAAYASLPDGSSRGVIVLHEIFGPQPEIERVVDRFARNGYAAVAPDLFHGRNPALCIRAAIQSTLRGEGPQIDQIRRARDWLCSERGLASDRVGLIGFCMGGGFALAAGRGWGAVSTNYGVVPPAKVLDGIGPVIGCYGGRDRMFRGSGPTLTRRLQRLGVEAEVHVFPEVGHSFLTDGHHPVAAALTRPLMRVEYNPEVAEQGWEKILAFFDRHLGAG
jgi:carboxymethylenebutenolidase